MFKILNLEVSYKKNKVIDINNFSFKEKGFYCIVGANGSGKTTLLKAMMNLISYKGTILYNDINIKDYKSELYKKVCYVDQFGNYINSLTTNENLSITNEIMDENVNVNVNKKITKSSGGERKIFELLRLKYENYETILLDEPSTELDKNNKKLLLDKIKELSKDKLIIVVTHDDDLIESCDEVYEIDKLEQESNIETINTYNANENRIKLPKKLFLSHLFINILITIFLSLTLFSSMASIYLANFKEIDHKRQLINNIGYSQITTNMGDRNYLSSIYDGKTFNTEKFVTPV